jgi:hypothetical protein
MCYSARGAEFFALTRMVVVAYYVPKGQISDGTYDKAL